MDNNELALELLKKLKASCSGELVNGFSFHKGFGICWHLYANTNNAINIDFLCPIFVSMNLDYAYPVEVQIHNNHTSAIREYHNTANKYDLENECGKVRLKLLDELIQYFEHQII